MFKIIIKHKRRNWGCVTPLDEMDYSEEIYTADTNLIKKLIDACNDFRVEYNIDTSALP